MTSSNENWKPFLKIIGGNLLIAFAYAKWMKPHVIINGGVTSVAMILNKITHLDLLYFTYGVTALLLLLCGLFLGKQNMLRSLLSSVCYTCFFAFFYKLIPFNACIWLPLDFILACIFIGIGYYCCLSSNSSTVGMDVLALIIHKYNPSADIAKMIRIINILVLIVGFFVYGIMSVIIGILFSICYSYILQLLLNNRFKISIKENE